MSNDPSETAFLQLLRHGIERGGFRDDDALAILLPLFREVAWAHESGLVAPLEGTGALRLRDAGALGLEREEFTPPRRNFPGLQQPSGAAMVENGPAYLPGYVTWEHTRSHHDPVTDILSLGLLLASLSCSLDLTEPEAVRRFAAQRENLFQLNPQLHPVVARMIVQMTELDRHLRAPDLLQVIRTLETYRDQPVDLDLSRITASSPGDRRRVIQEALRDRLFEISRRNRLIHFRETLQSLNLTVASVPLVLDPRNIRPEQILFWNAGVSAELSQGHPLSLGNYLRSDEAPHVPGILDRIIADARRDRAEFGFAQLRLVLCFLHWHNLKEAPEERIHSPLLLLPVELIKRKGVRDAYILTPVNTEAEVNPALRHHLKTLYGIALPESVDLQTTSIEQLHSRLQEQIRSFEPGVTLDKADQPTITALHTRATQQVEQWRKRQRTDRPLAGQTADQPEDASARGNAAAAGQSSPEISRKEDGRRRAVRPLEEGRSGNPYRWSFDTCNVTLGNFHYRKMTLVRDYTHLAEEAASSPGFDAVFSFAPKPSDEPLAEPAPLREQHPIVPADSAQAAAVARARRGSSFIIQGPPGTGKSQTITNLIADYVAEGKRVLFVCEKRAAIDVVFHRLRQQGLDELCCLIHDSQTDKKEFVLNLKQTYERWLALPLDDTSEKERAAALQTIEQDLAALDRFSRGMTEVTSLSGVPTRQLILRLVEAPSRPDLRPEAEELLPFYSLWLSHGSVVERLDATLQKLGLDPVFAHHAFRWLSRDCVLSPRPLSYLQEHLDALEPLLESVQSSLELSGMPGDLPDGLSDIQAVLDYAGQLLPLAAGEQLSLLDPASPLSRLLLEQTGELEQTRAAYEGAKQLTSHWRERPDPTDTAAALELAERLKDSSFRFLRPSFWKLRSAVRRRYDFQAHAVEPSLLRVLQDLRAEQQAEQAHAAALARFHARFGRTTPEALSELLTVARGGDAVLSPAATAFRRALLSAPEAAAIVRGLAEVRSSFARLKTLLGELLWSHEGVGLEELDRILTELRRDARRLPDLVPALSELVDAPEILRHAITHVELRLDQFEAACAQKTLHALYRSDPALTRFDARLLEAYRDRLQKQHAALLKKNASVIRARVRRAFREHVQLSTATAAQLTDEQQTFKKTYAAGRHELEHEFGKTMRYRSIRDLVAGPTGRVVRDLKPVWLMSPLSVSDTLPLDPGAFDVVIFDEASQIPVEEAVPAICRAPQVIVVGDQMQLPPTSFFTARETGEPLEAEMEGERVKVDLDADSFLAQSERNLPSALLAWHYRSRSESLISFSNAAFYGGRLLTIPDRQFASGSEKPLNVATTEEAPANVDALLTRSISFHFLERGVYQDRRNSAEADYIARTVRELLARGTGLSLGIVAFSEAQQTEIERALDALAEEDEAFAARLEAEINREQDDQFCGLFVKNLENVQGDERDVILLSICYGRDRNGRILMNFGPINQRGGEKRLNVIFSRARQHMAVVSSIHGDDITNDYNDGANALRNFLRYAEYISRGAAEEARDLLERLKPGDRRGRLGAGSGARDTVVEQLAVALRRRGHAVDLKVGQSTFRCDLAVCSKGGNTYELGVLIDTDAHYENPDLLDRYLTRPGILQAFGWQVLVILAKDWLHEPEAVVERIEQALRGEKSVSAPLPGGATQNRRSPPFPDAGAPVPGRAQGRPVPAAVVRPAGVRRYLEKRDGDPQRFWEIEVNGATCTVRFGRIGTAGQIQKKEFPTSEAARQAANQLTSAKLGKGYVESPR